MECLYSTTTVTKLDTSSLKMMSERKAELISSI